jgi:hypothetical protein
MVTIRADAPDQPLWRLPVSVYIRQSGGRLDVVGIEREGGENFAR